MNYDNFCSLWFDALKSASFPSSFPLWPTENVDTKTMDRSYSIIIHWPSSVQLEGRFNVTASLGWNWDSLLSARFSTTEEDMLMQIFGDFDIHENTEQPWLRVDISLNAIVSYKHPMPLPYESTWRSWVSEVYSQVSPIFGNEESKSGEEGGTLTWCGEPEARFQCAQSGELFLMGVNLSAFQGINLPRQWDHPDKWDEGPEQQIDDFFKRVKTLLQAWDDSLRFLYTR